MSIHKNEIPLLEFDTDKNAVIMPNHEHIDVQLPTKAVFAFLSDEIDTYAKGHNGKIVAEFETATKVFPVYTVRHEGCEICLAQAPTGAAAATQFLDWLIGYGVKEIVSAGSCGALDDIAENTFLVPCKALRDEGTSYHYMAPSRFIDIDSRARRAIKAALEKHGLPYREIITWTTDGFFRETADKVAYRKKEGCATVEMECSALAACARFRGVLWGQILFTADSLANVEKYDERGFGGDSFEYALHLCLDAVVAV
ncbi:MAG: nucleoside phosphorylase [Lachnospiraceae bacterium]|nr:nucleoside phosphorylase [Lachnospiraceae bacterium]